MKTEMSEQGLVVLNKIQLNKDKFKAPSIAKKDIEKPAQLKKIDEIFTRLKAICVVGNSFKTNEEQRILKQEFMFAMSEERVTNDMIDDAIEHFRTVSRKSTVTTWFPTISEFIAACLGSDDAQEYAERALNLFNAGQEQVDSVGKVIAGRHKFKLHQLKEKESNKLFIELYLALAKETEIKMLDAFAITETVQLSPEQQKDADDRKLSAQNECMDQLHGLFGKPKPKEVVIESTKSVGIQQGSLKTYTKSVKQLEAEKQRQLDMIKGMKQ